MKPSRAFTVVPPALMLAGSALAQLPVLPDLSAQPADPCRAEVAKFERAIGFIRQNQGNQAAADLKERLLPGKLEMQILLKDGYCGLAQYLRDKKLSR